MADQQTFPAVKQGVHLVAEDKGMTTTQLTAVVEALAPDGQLDLGCMDANKAAALKQGMTVTLEYFREGIVYKLRAAIKELLPRLRPQGLSTGTAPLSARGAQDPAPALPARAGCGAAQVSGRTDPRRFRSQRA